MPILRHIVDNIQASLKQAFDDSQLTPAQVAYWVIVVADRLKSQHIEKRSSGAFLTIFPNVPILKSATSGPNSLVKNRKYIELPGTIYDFNNDGAIEYISYWDEDDNGCEAPKFTQRTIQRTTPAEAEGLYMSPYETPSPRVPYYYRTLDKIYLLGLEQNAVETVEIGLYMAISPVTEIDLDSEFEFPAELVPILQRQVLDLGRFMLLMPTDNVNDGANLVSPATVPNNKIASVNDLNS